MGRWASVGWRVALLQLRALAGAKPGDDRIWKRLAKLATIDIDDATMATDLYRRLDEGFMVLGYAEFMGTDVTLSRMAVLNVIDEVENEYLSKKL